jgi:8-oxo-dGTP pyrophosphatase MutT (NUDIX family)
MFRHCPLLQPHHSRFDEIFDKFNEYRWSVPVCGCIMLNRDMDKILLVKGWSKRSSWGFPKGKIAKDEAKMPCAVREVLEETSFDCGPFVNEEDYIEIRHDGKQEVRLYICPNVPSDYDFQPQTKKEISKIEWVRIKEMNNKKGGNKSVDPAKTHMVLPFISELKAWITLRRQAAGAQVVASQGAAMHIMDVSTLERQMAETTVVSGAFDVSELERKNAANSIEAEITPAPAPEAPATARSGAQTSKSRGGKTRGKGRGKNVGGQVTDVPVAGKNRLPQHDNTTATEKDQQQPVVTCNQLGGSAATTGSGKSKRDSRRKSSVKASNAGGNSGAAKNADKTQRRHTRGHAGTDMDRPVVTCDQLGGSAAAGNIPSSVGGGSSTPKGGLTWQQTQQNSNPLLHFQLDFLKILG